MIRIGCMTILAAMMALAGTAVFSGPVQARNIYVPGHYLANGRYVAPYYRQVPDAPAYNAYPGGDPEANVAPVPVPYPYGAPYAPTPYGAPAPYRTPYATPYGAPAPGYVPNYGYVPR